MKPNDDMDNLHEYDENLVPATGFTMFFLAFLPVIWLPQDQLSVSVARKQPQSHNFYHCTVTELPHRSREPLNESL